MDDKGRRMKVSISFKMWFNSKGYMSAFKVYD